MKRIVVLFSTCLLCYSSFAQTAFGPITGPTTVCVGDTVTVHCSFGAILFWDVLYPTLDDTSILKIQSKDPKNQYDNDYLVIGVSPGIAKIACYNTAEMYDTITETVKTCPAAVPGISGASKTEIYPNPATHWLTISASEQINNVIITNLIGQAVYSHVSPGLSTGGKEMVVNVADLPSGVYFIKINGLEAGEFVKQ